VKIDIKAPAFDRLLLFTKLKPAVDRAVVLAQPKITALLIDRVTTTANAKLRTMAQHYRREIQKPGVVTTSSGGVTIEIKDPIVKALENGAPAFDLKARLLANAKKFSKKGVPYVDVVFQHSGASVPRAIKAKARSSGMVTTRVKGKTPGIAFDRKLQVKSALGYRTTKQPVVHKRGIQDDMIVSRGRAGRRASVSYATIRRISGKSAASSWMHPGFRPARIIAEVGLKSRSEIVTILRASLNASGVKTK
jgi:hypothetical protein